MSYKSLRIKEKLHKVLESMKRDGESFESLLWRIIENRSLADKAGSWRFLPRKEETMIWMTLEKSSKARDRFK